MAYPAEDSQDSRGLAVVAVAVLSLVPWQLRPHTGTPEAGPPGPSSGPPGPAGPPWPRPPADPAIRVITSALRSNGLQRELQRDEQILNTYALDPGGAIDFKDERNVTFRPKQRPTVLVLACIAVAQEPSVQDRARGVGTGRPVARSSLRPTLPTFPSKIERALPLPLASCQMLPRLRSSAAVRCRKRRPKDGVTRTCPTSRWKSTSAWPDRVQPTSLTASEMAS